MSSLQDKEIGLHHLFSTMKVPSGVLKPILADRTKAKLLNHAICRQVSLVLKRSERPEHGETTIYDRVLVKLWNEGHTLKNMGLLRLFVSEYLGGKLANTAEEEVAIVSACLTAQGIIENAGKPPAPPPPPLPSTSVPGQKGASAPASAHSETTVKEEPKAVCYHVENVSQITDEDLATENGPLGNLIQIYHRAKADYYLTDANKANLPDKSNEKFRNARFLRDTAENLLRCMQAQTLHNHPLLPEVEKVADASMKHVERLAGGKKRGFERDKARDKPRDNHRGRGQPSEHHRGYSTEEKNYPQGGYFPQEEYHPQEANYQEEYHPQEEHHRRKDHHQSKYRRTDGHRGDSYRPDWHGYH